MNRLVRRIARAVVLLFATAAIATTLYAQAGHPSDNDINQGQIQSFYKFLAYHPAISQAIKSNPNVANDPNFVRSHPELQSYFKKHPAVQGELKENASAFMAKEQQLENQEGGEINRGELTKFDQFLSQHPQIASDLKKNPPSADDANYLRSHPALQKFLSQHPAIAGELKENPDLFMSKAESFHTGNAPK